jgi:mRNA interferase MazF
VLVTRKDPALWIPDRQEIIWIDCNPQAGREMRDRHPFLVLSTRPFNDRTSLVIGLPMTTADYNSDNPFAVIAGKTRVANALRTSYVLCHQPKSFDWRARHGAAHPMGKLSPEPFEQVCDLLNQIIQLNS